MYRMPIKRFSLKIKRINVYYPMCEISVDYHTCSGGGARHDYDSRSSRDGDNDNDNNNNSKKKYVQKP